MRGSRCGLRPLLDAGQAEACGFGDVVAQDVGVPFEIGNGAGDAHDAVIAACGEAETVCHFDQERAALGIGGGDAFEFFPFEIGIEAGRAIGAVGLGFAGAGDAGSDGGGSVARGGEIEVAVGDGRDFDAEVEAVHQGAGDAADVIVAAGGGAGAGAGGIGEIAAAAGIGGGDQEEAAGIGDVRVGAGDHDFAGFDGLAQGFEHGAGEFGQFVEKKDAVMGEADLAGFRAAPAADNGRHGGGVMRGAEGAGAADAAFGEKARERVDHRGFERFDGGERRQDGGEAGGEHGFAGTRRAHKEEVVAASSGDFERAFGFFLPLDVAEAAGACAFDHFPGLGGR